MWDSGHQQCSLAGPGEGVSEGYVSGLSEVCSNVILEEEEGAGRCPMDDGRPDEQERRDAAAEVDVAVVPRAMEVPECSGRSGVVIKRGGGVGQKVGSHELGLAPVAAQIL